MNSLADIQEAFDETIAGDAAPLQAGILPAGSLTEAEACAVYSRAYEARLSEALGDTFELTWRILGDDDFLESCSDYIAAVRSLSYNLSDYGDRFADFLEHRFPGVPLLGEVSRFEWQMARLFHAAEPEGFVVTSDILSELATRPLFFEDSFFLFESPSPIGSIWGARDDEQALEQALELSGPSYLCVFKLSHRLHCEELTLLQYKVWRDLLAGSTLETALQSLSDSAAPEVSGLFSLFARGHLIRSARPD